MFKEQLLLFISIVLFSITIYGQNLVPNPSFEELIDCPDNNSGLYLAEHWFNPSNGTPDIFNRCHPMGIYGEYECPLDTGNYSLDSWQTAVPINILGCQEPNSGNGYSGVIISNWTSWREYIQVEFTEQMEENETYFVQLFVNLGDVCRLTSDALQIAFVEDSVFFDSNYVIDLEFDLQNEIGNIDDDDNWIELNWEYVSDGTENYMIIGNFKNDGDFLIETIEGAENNYEGTYFYIDDVYVGKEENISVGYIEKPNHNCLIYPNPVNSNIFLDMCDESFEEYIIYDLNFKVLEGGGIVNDLIDVSSLSVGYYMLYLYSDEIVQVLKLIVE